MLDNVFVISTKNVATIQSQDTEFNETVSLPVAQSTAIIEDQYSSIKLYFGSWVGSGDEDKQLEEIYRARLVPSISPDE